MSCILQVNFSLELNDINGENYTHCTLLRQNENQELVMYIKAPARGYYALKVYGTWWKEEGDVITRSHVATYLLAAFTAARDHNSYSGVPGQRCGEDTPNIR